MKRCIFIFLSIAYICISLVPVQADEQAGEVRICIQDEKQQSIKHVEIRIENEFGTMKTLKSNEQGMVYLNRLKPGKYQMLVSVPKGYQEYEKQEFYITKYNQQIGMELTIQLRLKQKNFIMQSDSLFLFVCLCNAVLYLGIYIFKTYNIHNFTQSLDDFML